MSAERGCWCPEGDVPGDAGIGGLGALPRVSVCDTAGLGLSVWVGACMREASCCRGSQ